jgi:hypothetical protein
MRLRKLLTLTVLTAALFTTLLTGSPTKARYCGENCVEIYNWCEASCNGRGGCIKACQREYGGCMCSNCGLCPINPPQAASKARTSAATTPGTTKGQVGVTSGQAAP